MTEQLSMTTGAVAALDMTRAYHVGVRVLDLDAAMEQMSKGSSVTWCTVQERLQPVWTPSTGAIETNLRFTYSTAGPIHIELLEGEPGTLWDGAAGAGLHHLGVWADDVPGQTSRLLEAGWAIVGSALAPESGFGTFTYVASPDGTIIELVATAAQPRFERWWAGASSL